MPHVIVKLYPGRSEEQKTELSRKIAEQVVNVAKCEDSVVSVSIEEIDPEKWHKTVYEPDIMNKQEQLYKKPGYGPLK